VEDIHNWQSTFTLCSYSERLLQKILLKNSTAEHPVDINEVKKAIYYAKKYHGEQLRKSGEPYYSHPLEVAYRVSDYLFQTNAIVVSILHDTIEDTALTFEMIEAIFGHQVAIQVDDLTRIKTDQKISAAELIENLWFEKKYDLVLIKLFDRLHNMQTIGAMSREKAQKTINETLKYFLVLSEMMNLPNLCDYLYDECYKANVTSGVVTESTCVFAKEFKFPGLPTFGNVKDS
jgi:(p)ppGpp synthase/HD superfamily hydrolase